MCFIIIFVDSATKLCFFRKTKPKQTQEITTPRPQVYSSGVAQKVPFLLRGRFYSLAIFRSKAHVIRRILSNPLFPLLTFAIAKYFLNLHKVSKISTAPSLSQSWESKQKNSNLLADPCMSCLQYPTATKAYLMSDEVLVIFKYFFPPALQFPK